MRDVAAVEHQGQHLLLVDGRLLERQQLPHGLHLLEVVGHVGAQDHFDDEAAQLAELLARQVRQDVELVLAQQPEAGAGMVVLQDGPIVVQQGRLRSGHHVEVVGGARVLVVVEQSRQQRGEDLQVRQPVHQARVAQAVVDRLHHVHGVQVVVVRVPVPAVALLHAMQERLQRPGRYLELVDRPVAVEQLVGHVLHHLATGRLRQGEHVERPVVQVLRKQER